MTDPLATLSPDGIRYARHVIDTAEAHDADKLRRAIAYTERYDCDPAYLRKAATACPADRPSDLKLPPMR